MMMMMLLMMKMTMMMIIIINRLNLHLSIIKLTAAQRLSSNKLQKSGRHEWRRTFRRARMLIPATSPRGLDSKNSCELMSEESSPCSRWSISGVVSEPVLHTSGILPPCKRRPFGCISPHQYDGFRAQQQTHSEQSESKQQYLPQSEANDILSPKTALNVHLHTYKAVWT